MVKIKKTQITNYRSCLDATFSPDEYLSVLIGPNGSGKTNLLSAIRLLPLLMQGPTHRRTDPSTSSLPPCEIKTQFDLNGMSVLHSARILVTTNERNQDEILSVDEFWQLPELTGSRKKISLPTWVLVNLFQVPASSVHARNARQFWPDLAKMGLDQRALDALLEVVNFMKGISYYGASQFTNPSQSPLSFDVEFESTRMTGLALPTGHKKLLYDMYQEFSKQSDSYAEYINIVGPDGIGLVESIAFQEIPTHNSNYSVLTGGRIVERKRTNKLVVPSFSIAGSSLSPNQLSEGTFKALALIFYVITDKSSLLMIEEPEVCVHHGLLSSIVELIRVYSHEKQIFISTHSESVLDRVEINNVFRVSRSTNGTQVSGLRGNVRGRELKALKRYLQEDGSLGEFWKHGDLEHV